MPQANVRPPSAPSAPTATPQNVVSPSVATWQGQLADLGGQAANLRATLSRLNRQLNNMRIDNPARAGVQQQAANVASQLAVVEGKMAELQTRIAVAVNVSPDRITEQGTVLPPNNSFPFRRNPDPDMVFGLSFVLAMCIVLPISIAWAKRIWRGKPQAPAPRMDDIAPRLERLEQAVDSIAIEIERVSEGQRFVTQILAERPTQASQPQDSALPEGQPVLALGAGPAEPVRVNQGVKQGVNQR